MRLASLGVHTRVACCSIAVTLVLLACSGAEYDIILRGGQVLDGTGSAMRVADVGIAGGLIVTIGDLEGHSALQDLDVTGLYVTPGFIDVHSHAGPGLTSADLSSGEPLLAQGLTTVVVNPDGGGPTDLAEQRRALEEFGLGLNVAQLSPHGSIRRQIMGMEDRAPDEDEIGRMKTLVRDAMEEGAWGMSSGTFYTPASYSNNDELVALAGEIRTYGGVYTSHIRDESNYTIGVVAAVDEVIEVAREAGVTGIVTHIKALGPPVWGASAEMIQHIEAARFEGVRVFADQYPYLASATGLGAALLPRWAQVGGRDSLLARLDDPSTLAQIRGDMVNNLARRGGADRIQFRRFVPDPSIEGRLLSELADERGRHALDVAVDLLVEGSPSIVSFNMDEGDLKSLMTQSWTMTSSDGDLPRMGVGVPHPRSYGAFPKKLRAFVFEDSVVSLPAAIRSMTGLPAEVFGLDGRGFLNPGLAADVVVFSPEIQDQAVFTDPHQLSTGVVHLLVAGEFTIRDEAFTGMLPGKVLKKGQWCTMMDCPEDRPEPSGS